MVADRVDVAIIAYALSAPHSSTYETKPPYYSVNIRSTFGALAFSAMAAFTLTSCQEEKADSITVVNPARNNGQGTLLYTIQVVDASGNNGGRASGVPNATIKYMGSAGRQITKTTDTQGNLVLNDVRPGSLSGRFEANGYTSMDFTADLGNGVTDSGQQTFASTRLYAIRQNAYLKGLVYGNFSGAGGVLIPGQPNATTPVFMKVIYRVVRNGANAYPMGNGAGRLTDISIDQATLTFDSDNGRFLFDGIHATESGMIEAFLSMRPVVRLGNGTNRQDSSFVLDNRRFPGAAMNMIPVTLISNDTVNLGPLLARPMR
jgi:hypothetical protein